MRVIKPYYEIMYPSQLTNVNSTIANAARTCYQSSPADDGRMVRSLVRSGHTAMLEHASMTVKFVCDRGISHEIVRHRLASFGQESTRYCNYAKDKFNSEITVIKPRFFDEGTEAYDMWYDACKYAEKQYFALLNEGCSPEQARTVLPTSVKTEIIMTADMTEWRHFFRLRALGTTGSPHPQMTELALPLLKECVELMPDVFGDLL